MLVIAGGGTGGHLFSGLAVAEEWVRRGNQVCFVGTARGFEKQLVPKHGFSLELIPGSSLKGKGFLKKIKALAKLPHAFAKSFTLLRKLKPDVVLGIGGYASGPFVMVAQNMGYKTAILDQNSVPGYANRRLGKKAKKVFLAFEEAASYFKENTPHVVGNPILQKRRQPIKNKSIDPQKPFTLLVCGGSQGAHKLNELMMDGLNVLFSHDPHVRILHQTGERDYAWISNEFNDRGIRGEVAPFFHDIEKKYAEADLVISRAGAGTLTEIALWGLPSILVPYPFAADWHQQKNADVFVKRGAAFALAEEDLNGYKLAKTIIQILSDKDLRQEMSAKAQSLAKPRAAENVVNELLLM